MEGAMISQSQEAFVGSAQVLKQENKIDVQGGPLHAAHGHGKSADKSVADPSGRKFRNNFGDGGFEIQGSAGSACFSLRIREKNIEH
jgi:hypothetical protein